MKQGDFTGDARSCTLIDGTRREFPLAQVNVGTPFFTGKLLALVMENPLSDVILGNILGARVPDNPEEQKQERSAVETRSQKADKGKLKPLLVPARRAGIDAFPAEIQKAQQDDPSLAKLLEVAMSDGKEEVRGGEAKLELRKGLLFRISTSAKTGKETTQLVVPVQFRETVMSVGHESLFAVHLGTTKTADRVLGSFYWPEVMADVKRFCASCETCQFAREHLENG